MPHADCFIPFNENVEHLGLPEWFTFPFFYRPHPLAERAAEKLQHYLLTQTDWKHNFGLDSQAQGMVIGKMFGVLVVKNSNGQLGYLAAFSGKLAGGNHHAFFVPPVFDMLTDGSFFLSEEEKIVDITRKIETLENSEELRIAQKSHTEQEKGFLDAIENIKRQIKNGKERRKKLREELQNRSDETEKHDLEEQLRRESIKEQYHLKDFSRSGKEHLAISKQQINLLLEKIEQLKSERKQRSAALQQRLFDSYSFLNIHGERKSLGKIFEPTFAKYPPAGAGECAAPKLLHYAFLHNLKPIALAEFWWGTSPASEIRKHKHFYPACRGKCEPILAHMLKDIPMDENPMAVHPDESVTVDVVYEDDFLAVVNKPAEFLSVPGIAVKDSVYLRMKNRYPSATGPLVVHRLDMSTSGILLVAKTEEAHRHLQRQFIKRTIKKRYVAVLDGELMANEGFIDLPLRGDLDDRPRQLVCPEYGKPAQTRYEVISRENGKTRVHFFPITGRTHQLRVHAAHPSGLNMPIVGDDLYGSPAARLHLHADHIEFRHPESNKIVSYYIPADF